MLNTASNTSLENISLSSNAFHVLIEQKSLLKALSHQQGLVDRKTTVPILSHIYLEAKDQKLFLKGTDLEMSLVEVLNVQVLKEGQTTVFAHLFKDLVRKFSDTQPIHLVLSEKGELILKSGSAHFALPTLPAESFPSIEHHLPTHSITLLSKDFKQLIDDTYTCMSTDEARYSLNGIFFHLDTKDQWRAVATDAHRLGLSILDKLPDQNEGMPSIMVGRKTIIELKKLLEEAPEQISLSVSAHHLVFSYDGLTFSSRLLEGQFPDYQKAIPEDQPYEVLIPVESFAESVSRVSMVSAEKQRLVQLCFSKDQLKISAHSQQLGSGQEVIKIDYEGPELTVRFNPQYLLDICQNIKGDFFKLGLKDALSTAIFQDVGRQNVLYVLMPIR